MILGKYYITVRLHASTSTRFALLLQTECCNLPPCFSPKTAMSCERVRVDARLDSLHHLLCPRFRLVVWNGLTTLLLTLPSRGRYGHSMVADSRGVLWVHGGALADATTLSDRVRARQIAACCFVVVVTIPRCFRLLLCMFTRLEIQPVIHSCCC